MKKFEKRSTIFYALGKSFGGNQLFFALLFSALFVMASSFGVGWGFLHASWRQGGS